MSEITNPRELFIHELGDILYVERNLVAEALPKLIGEVTDDELKSGLERHLTQTKTHVSNVEKVFELMGETPHEEECVAFEGLKKEHEEMTKEACVVADRPRRPGRGRSDQNYEIAAYEGLRRMAKALGEERCRRAPGHEPRPGEGGAAGRREDRDEESATSRSRRRLRAR